MSTPMAATIFLFVVSIFLLTLHELSGQIKKRNSAAAIAATEDFQRTKQFFEVKIVFLERCLAQEHKSQRTLERKIARGGKRVAEFARALQHVNSSALEHEAKVIGLKSELEKLKPLEPTLISVGSVMLDNIRRGKSVTLCFVSVASGFIKDHRRLAERLVGGMIR